MANENNRWFRSENSAPVHINSLQNNTNNAVSQSNTPATQTSALQSRKPIAAVSQYSPQHSQTIGQRGPVLMQDTALHETMQGFASAPFARRVVHTKGFGAFGFFRPADSMHCYTAAGFLNDPLRQTQVAARFSLAAGDDGTPDTSRNIRGLAVKFYTHEGVFDLLCDSVPVFFVRDPIKVPETIAALGPSPVHHLPDPNQVWGMFARTPEATNLLTWFFSDVGTSKSFRTISYYGVNTYVWRNAQGVRRYVKYRWAPVAGEAYIDQQEAARLAIENPNISGQDLYDTIASGAPVEFDLYVQLMDPEDETMLPYDPLDDTKVWDTSMYTPLLVGRMTLNQNPANYMEQVEKLAFAPANLVKGIELSDDKMLQGRAIVYSSAQRHRLGKDFRKLPVNAQASWSAGDMTDSGDDRWVEGVIGRTQIPKQDDFAQAGQRYNAMTDQQKRNLIDNLAAGLSAASGENQKIVLGHLRMASAEFASRVSEKISKP